MRNANELRQLQSLPLEVKIRKSELRIKEFYEMFDGELYISFSGGRDSTVLLHLVRQIYPDMVAVFVDTGLEFPENRRFALSKDNIVKLKPKMTFREVLSKYGFPLISKEQSQFIYEYRNTNSDKLKDIRWNGNKWGRGKISQKWKPIVDTDIPISDKCCRIMKKAPLKAYEKKTGKKPLIGVMTEESSLRRSQWVRYGCNAFEATRPVSNPMSFWVKQDILDYIEMFDLDYSPIYDMGYEQTGCMFCAYGYQYEDPDDNRFTKLKKSHPKVYDFCMDDLGMRQVLEIIDKLR